MPNSTLVTLFCILSFLSAAQKREKERFPSYFGITASPVIPNNFIGAVHTTFTNDSGSINADFHNKWGFTFGATIRIGLTKFISLETGITQVRRIYGVSVSIPDSTISAKQKLTFLNYDFPINALFYVPLSKKWLADASLGVSVTHYPSNAQDTIYPAPKRTIFVQGRRTERTYFALNAGIGFEYRNLKAGSFFLGFGAKVPLKPPLFGVSIYRYSKNGNRLSAYKPIEAGYFTIDFRYFLPINNKKKLIANKPIIE